jgi:hypothetical protein
MPDHPIRLLLTDDLERRRVTVVFRLILAIPHLVWFAILTIIALLLAIVSWLVTLIAARTPEGLHRFLAMYVKYATQLYAYLHLAAEPYPSFAGADGYPVDLSIDPPQRQSRLKVLFRLPLAIPALLLVSVLSGNGFSVATKKGGGSYSARSGLLFAVGVFSWFAILARGRAQRGLRDAAAYSLAYGAQFWGYALLLTDRYPNSDPYALVPDLPRRDDPIQLRREDDLRRSRLTVFFRVLLVLPHLVWLLGWTILAFFAVIASWLATLAGGTPPAALHGFLARYVRYAISVYAFLYVIANPFPGFGGAPGGYPLDVVVAGPARQSRAKVLFRLIPLALPALVLMSVYDGLVTVAGILGWWASLITGRMPKGLRNAGALALRYHAQALGYLLLLTDTYPYTGPCVEGPGEQPGAVAATASSSADDPFATSAA